MKKKKKNSNNYNYFVYIHAQLDDWVLCRIYKKNNTARPMDHERDHHHHDMNDLMASMTPSISLGSHNKYHHQGPIKTTMTCNYGALLENEHHNNNSNNSMMFEQPGLMSSDGSISHLTSATKQHLLSAGGGGGSGVIPVKRTLPALYWNDEGNACSSPPTKRFLADGTTTTDDGGGGGGGTRTDDINTSNSIASLLSQLPQTPNSLHQQSLLGSIGDGAVFRQPYQVSGMNWYS